MKHINQTRALLLSCCLLVLASWSAAQGGLISDTNRSGEPKPGVTTIPAGTHLLMKLISPLHTTSSTPGSGVYLDTAFPIVENSRVVISEHTRAMRVVTDERSPYRLQGRAHIRLRLTQLILPHTRE